MTHPNPQPRDRSALELVDELDKYPHDCHMQYTHHAELFPNDGGCKCWKSRLPALRARIEAESKMPEHVSRMVDAIIAYPEAYEGFGLELATWVKSRFKKEAP